MLTDPTVTSITVDPPLSPAAISVMNSLSSFAYAERHTNPTAHGFCGHSQVETMVAAPPRNYDEN